MAGLPYSEKILELAGKWVNGTITESERQEFIDWYNQFDDKELLLPAEYAPLIRGLEAGMLTSIRQRIAAEASPVSSDQPGRLYRMKTRRIAAAAIVALVVLTAVLLVRRTGSASTRIAAQKVRPAPADILPGSNRATLTLADGSTITLDSAHTGNLARQGRTEVLKPADGELKYNAVAANKESGISYNILSTPRGGQYRLILSDGTHVWLNAASSIRYPTSFTGKDREVEISGEAYFEIAKNASMPFRVLTVNHPGDADPMTIDVLGTHFNVNAYTDEPDIRTTLLEGSIRVTKGRSSELLKPGQAAQLQRDGVLRQIPEADLEEAVAWKDGMFEFDGIELQAIMRQISRWYNIDVQYEGAIPTDTFTGRVSRNTSLSGVLKILKLSDVQLTVTDNKIIVKS